MFFFFFLSEANKSGNRVVIRDKQGLVIAHLWVQQLPQAHNTAEVEAMAAGRAIEFGLQWVLLEGDSEAVVTAPDGGFWISSLWVVTQGC